MNSIIIIAKKAFKPEFSLFWILALTFGFFSMKVGNYFYSTGNLMNILAQASAMAIMVLGVTWVIGANEMDCSFPDIAACASMIFAMMVHKGNAISISIICALVVGVLLGLMTSFFVVKFNFHSLITTIAMATIAKSIAAIIYQGMPLPIPCIKSTSFNAFINSSYMGIPMIFIITIVLYIGLYILQEKTKYGQYIYAMGENRQAVKETGIKAKRILTSVFVTSAAFAAFGGILMVFTVYGSGQPKMGSSFFLDGFTTVFLGAMVMKLGKTNVVGTFFGALMLAVLVNGMTMMGSSFATGQIIKGLLLVIGVVVVSMTQKRKRGKVGILKYE